MGWVKGGFADHTSDNTIRAVLCILHAAVDGNLLAIISSSCRIGDSLAAINGGHSITGNLVISNSNPSGSPLHPNCQHTCIVGNGIVTLGHHANIVITDNIGLIHFRRGITANEVIAVGATDGEGLGAVQAYANAQQLSISVGINK